MSKFIEFVSYMNSRKNDSYYIEGLGTQVCGHGSNGPSAYPMMMSSGSEENNKKIEDNEEENILGFKTWFDKIDKESESDKMLTRIKKNKFDTTKEKHTIPGSKKSIFPKKDTVTVWGAPQDHSYIRN